MKLIKLGYEPSKKVKRYSDIKKDVELMLPFVDKEHEGQYTQAYAVSHCQVSEHPFAFFVVNTGLVKNDKIKLKQMLFPHRVIINPEIIDEQETLDVELPGRDGKKEVVKMKNTYSPDEACMSFPHRAPKHTKRYYKIKVRYQIPGLLGLKTIKEECDGLKAHIFQHETDHANGKNIFYTA